MAKVTEYPRITKMKDNDILLVDGPDGTRTILQTNASKQMGGEVIMVNETAGDSTKVVINTTDEDIELATMADLDPVETDVSELKTQINTFVTEEQSVNIFPGYVEPGGIVTADGTDNNSDSAKANYVRSDYFPVDGSESTIYVLRETALWGLRLFFYDTNKTFISQAQIFNGNATILSGSATIPSNAAFIRTYRDATVNSWVVLSYTAQTEYTPYQIEYVMKDGVVSEHNLDNALKEKINALPLTGKTIAIMGDSIIGNFYDDTGICNIIAEKSGANVINCAFGGTRMAYRYSTAGDATPGASGYNPGATDAQKNQVDQYRYWNALSGYALANAIVSQVWTYQDSAMQNLNNKLAYFDDRLAEIKAVDWSQVDYLMWEYGTNDFSTSVKLDDTADPTNLFAFDIAYREAIETLLTAYPNLRIIPITPIYKWWNDGDSFLYDSNTHTENDYGGQSHLLTDFVKKVQEIANDYQLPCIDDYYSLGANKLTRSADFDSTDGTHPNASGRMRIAEHILAQYYAGTQSKYYEGSEQIEYWESANLLRLDTATFGKRLQNDGSTTDVAQFLISDYIDVELLDTVYYNKSVIMTEVSDASKNALGYKASVSSLDLTQYTGHKYIRVSLACTDAYTLIVGDKSSGVDADHGLSVSKPIENLNVNKQIAKWDKENRNSEENILQGAAYTFYQCCGYKNYDITRDGEYSITLVSKAGENVDLRAQLPAQISVNGVQKITLKFYLTNAANVSTCTFAMIDTAGGSDTTIYTITTTRTFSEGWNEITVQPAKYDAASFVWSTATKFRIYFTGTGAFTVTVAAIDLGRIAKGKLIFVDDHGYHGFKTLAYPLLKAAGQPVTWAINPGRLGTTVGTQESILTQEDIDELAYDAFSEFSFHNWNPQDNPTETMTPAELRQDYQKCITYLKKNGICPTHLWRAALTQNRADNWWVAQDMVEAAASHTTGATFTTWPFDNAYNVPRYLIHGRSQADIDGFFDKLQKTHCTLVLYTHGCVVERGEGDSLHSTVAEIEYLCSKIAAGVSGGWLEPTTYNRLATMREHGMYTLTTE